jgi:hypothetical protein
MIVSHRGLRYAPPFLHVAALARRAAPRGGAAPRARSPPRPRCWRRAAGGARARRPLLSRATTC